MESPVRTRMSTTARAFAARLDVVTRLVPARREPGEAALLGSGTEPRAEPEAWPEGTMLSAQWTGAGHIRRFGHWALGVRDGPRPRPRASREQARTAGELVNPVRLCSWTGQPLSS